MYLKKRMVTILVVVLALGLIVAGCGKQAKEGTESNETNILLVGAALPVTGDLSPQGKTQKEGYELWKNAVNEKGGIKVGDKTYKVDIKYYDYASDTNMAVKLAEKLIVEDKVKFILGPYGSASLAAVAPIVEKYGVIMMAPSGASTKIYEGRKFTFGTLTPSATYAKAWLEAIKKKDPTAKTIAILGRNDLFPLEGATSIKDQAPNFGLEVVHFETYPVGVKDLTTPLTTIKNKKPDLFFFTGYANDDMLAIRQAKQIGLKVKAFGATAGLTNPDFMNGMKTEANGITSVESWFTTLPDTFKDDLFGNPQDYAKLYKKAFNYDIDPPYTTASSSVCGLILQKSIERAGSLDPAKVRDEMAKFNEMTFYGPIKFNANGQLERPAYALQIDYPKTVSITPGLETGEFVYPMK